MKLLLWLSQSPDLNPIEALWALIKEELTNFFLKTKTVLKAKN